MSLSELTRAVKEKSLTDIEELLHEHADVNAPDTNGDLPLTLAARGGDEAIVTRLLDAGAAVNAPDAEGDTALLIAVSYKHAAVIDRLLGAGADPAIPNHKGETATAFMEKPQRDELRPAFMAAVEKFERRVQDMRLTALRRVARRFNLGPG